MNIRIEIPQGTRTDSEAQMKEFCNAFDCELIRGKRGYWTIEAEKPEDIFWLGANIHNNLH